jgi:hypothetical protein
VGCAVCARGGRGCAERGLGLGGRLWSLPTVGGTINSGGNFNRRLMVLTMCGSK